MKYVVYCHLFPNKKRYIGITSQLPEYRWNNGEGYSSQVLVYRAIKRYGWENIQHLILAEDLTKQEAIELEKFYISKYNTLDKKCGYNLTAGGEGGCKYSPSAETRRKLSEANRGRRRSDEFRRACAERARNQVMTAETKQKISNTMKLRGSNHLTPEQRAKLSAALIGNTNAKGTVQSAEANEKRSVALRGVTKSEETKAKMRKPKSEEAKRNMKRAQEERWRKYYESKQMSQGDGGSVRE